MSEGATAQLLPDGRRLHLHHGPIDLIAAIEGCDIGDAHAAAMERFRDILDELVAELPALRQPLRQDHPLAGAVARRMAEAVRPFSNVFVTPMAAVAGAVADEILTAILATVSPVKASVNNGGDVAFFLAPGAEIVAAGPGGPVRIGAKDPSRGLATSGWRGRSHSLGIADAVTVAAPTAAAADAAATLIANAVDLPGHPAIVRQPARTLAPDSDLGHRFVTVHVGPLTEAEVQSALSRGRAFADTLCRRGVIDQAVLSLGGQTCVAAVTPQLEGALNHA